MSRKIRAFIGVVRAGLMLGIIFSCIFVFNKLSRPTPIDAQLPKCRTNTIVAPSGRLNTPDELLYSTTTSGEAQFLPYDKQLIDNIRNHISQPNLTQPRLLSKPHETDRSQYGQSAFVDKLLSGRQNGFFIECGAADGQTYSNSLFFEMERNWTGILIDANPLYHSALLKLNRRAYVLHACLSTERRPTVMSIRLHNLFSSVSHNQKLGTKVNCFPLDAVLQAINVTHVDYFSLDVEGPELEILHTIDWSKLQIDVLSIEYRINRGARKTETETLNKLQHLRQFFRNLGLYREVTLLPARASEAYSLDIVFSRV